MKAVSHPARQSRRPDPSPRPGPGPARAPSAGTRAPVASALRLLILAAAATGLSGCGALTRIQNIGEMPPLTTIQDPTREPGYRPVQMPMPQPLSEDKRPGSLWASGTRAFFKDQRAAQVGDLLTVTVNLNEQAQLQNQTKRDRTGSDTANIGTIFGAAGQLQKAGVLARTVTGGGNSNDLLDAKGTSSSDGKGQINRTEQIVVNIAANVTQALPNGNLVIFGRQEMRVNYEVREIQIAGVIRPQDISSTNTIDFSKVAQARLSYGGRGTITEIQQPRYGQQLFDVILPW